MRRPGAALALLLLVTLGSVPATASIFDFFDDLAGPRSRPETAAAPATGPTTFEPGRPFVVGRDNLGFANPSGAVSVAGMSGNCYTMALVARMFHERARFHADQPAGRPKGLSLAALAAALEANGSFDVWGYPSLLEMTRAASIPQGRLDEWMDEMTRHRVGLAPAPPAEAAPANTDALVATYELVSTIHYLHYMQNQAANFIESVVTRALGDQKTPGRVSIRTVERMSGELKAGKLPLLLIFNTKVTYGHVVLAYRIERHGPDAGGGDVADVYVYDSNAQYGTNLHESILRVDMTSGRYQLWRRPAGGGTLQQDSLYKGDEWFDGADACLIALPDPNTEASERSLLARKLRVADEETGYLFAVGDFIKQTTTSSPSQSTLFDDTRDMIVAMEKVQARLGINPSYRTAPLPADADVTTLNRYLGTNTDAAFRAIFPYALPPGVVMSGTSVRFDTKDPNTAFVGTTVDIGKGLPLDEVVAALESSALFAGQNKLASLVRGVGNSFKGEHVRVSASLRLKKGPCNVSTLGAYAPIPTLLKSHVVVGDMTPALKGTEGDHVIEVGSDILGKASMAALESQGVLGEKFEFAYDFTVLKTFKRRGYVVLDSLKPETATAGLVVAMAAHGFAPVLTENRGVSFSTKRTAGTLAMTLDPSGARNRIVVAASFAGDLSIQAGLTKLGDRLVFGALTALAEKVFPRFAGGIESFLQSQLATWVVLVPGSKIHFSKVDLGATKLSFSLDPFTVDVDATVKKLLGQDTYARVKRLSATGDRFILVLNND